MTAERLDSMAEVVEALRSARSVTAICHENPDADTIGAAVAMCLIADRLGALSEIVSADAIPPAFAFLPRVSDARRRPALEPDLAVVCDAATLDRVGRVAREEEWWLSRARLLNIDHHVTNDGFGDLNLVDPQAAATCEVVARLVDPLGLTLDGELASALLTGIVRDSQGFADPSTSGDTLRTAAALVDAGAPLAEIHRRVLAELPYATVALWGRLLGELDQAADGRIVHTTLTQRMLDETGTQQHDADGLVEFLSRTQGADVTLLMRALGPSETRISVRTSEAVDATLIAARYGGGGHARRAGCIAAVPVDTARREILEASRSALAAR